MDCINHFGNENLQIIYFTCKPSSQDAAALLGRILAVVFTMPFAIPSQPQSRWWNQLDLGRNCGKTAIGVHAFRPLVLDPIPIKFPTQVQLLLATDLRQNGRRLVLQHRPLQVPFLEGRLVKKHHQLFLAISLKFKALTYYIYRVPFLFHNGFTQGTGERSMFYCKGCLGRISTMLGKRASQYKFLTHGYEVSIHWAWKPLDWQPTRTWSICRYTCELCWLRPQFRASHISNPGLHSNSRCKWQNRLAVDGEQITNLHRFLG